jgi:hypothetical protein
MADVQVATCDGGKLDPSLSYPEGGGECDAEPLLLTGEGPAAAQLAALEAGWVRRKFTGPKYEDDVRWWSFCPDHVRLAVEQFYLARFSDGGE